MVKNYIFRVQNRFDVNPRQHGGVRVGIHHQSSFFVTAWNDLELLESLREFLNHICWFQVRLGAGCDLKHLLGIFDDSVDVDRHVHCVLVSQVED